MSWIADGNGFSNSWDISNSEQSICTVTTSRKDADLIAAAPELLEACKEFIACGANAGHNNDLVMQVMTAISKAEGGSK